MNGVSGQERENEDRNDVHYGEAKISSGVVVTGTHHFSSVLDDGKEGEGTAKSTSSPSSSSTPFSDPFTSSGGICISEMVNPYGNEEIPSDDKRIGVDPSVESAQHFKTSCSPSLFEESRSPSMFEKPAVDFMIAPKSQNWMESPRSVNNELGGDGGGPESLSYVAAQPKTGSTNPFLHHPHKGDSGFISPACNSTLHQGGSSASEDSTENHEERRDLVTSSQSPLEEGRGGEDVADGSNVTENGVDKATKSEVTTLLSGGLIETQFGELMLNAARASSSSPPSPSMEEDTGSTLEEVLAAARARPEEDLEVIDVADSDEETSSEGDNDHEIPEYVQVPSDYLMQRQRKEDVQYNGQSGTEGAGVDDESSSDDVDPDEVDGDDDGFIFAKKSEDFKSREEISTSCQALVANDGIQVFDVDNNPTNPLETENKPEIILKSALLDPLVIKEDDVSEVPYSSSPSVLNEDYKFEEGIRREENIECLNLAEETIHSFSVQQESAGDPLAIEDEFCQNRHPKSPLLLSHHEYNEAEPLHENPGTLDSETSLPSKKISCEEDPASLDHNPFIASLSSCSQEEVTTGHKEVGKYNAGDDGMQEVEEAIPAVITNIQFSVEVPPIEATQESAAVEQSPDNLLHNVSEGAHNDSSAPPSSLESLSGPASVIVASQVVPNPDQASFIIIPRETDPLNLLPSPQEAVVEHLPEPEVSQSPILEENEESMSSECEMAVSMRTNGNGVDIVQNGKMEDVTQSIAESNTNVGLETFPTTAISEKDATMCDETYSATCVSQEKDDSDSEKVTDDYSMHTVINEVVEKIEDVNISSPPELISTSSAAGVEINMKETNQMPLDVVGVTPIPTAVLSTDEKVSTDEVTDNVSHPIEMESLNPVLDNDVTTNKEFISPDTEKRGVGEAPSTNAEVMENSDTPNDNVELEKALSDENNFFGSEVNLQQEVINGTDKFLKLEEVEGKISFEHSTGLSNFSGPNSEVLANSSVLQEDSAVESSFADNSEEVQCTTNEVAHSEDCVVPLPMEADIVPAEDERSANQMEPGKDSPVVDVSAPATTAEFMVDSNEDVLADATPINVNGATEKVAGADDVLEIEQKDISISGIAVVSAENDEVKNEVSDLEVDENKVRETDSPTVDILSDENILLNKEDDKHLSELERKTENGEVALLIEDAHEKVNEDLATSKVEQYPTVNVEEPVKHISGAESEKAVNLKNFMCEDNVESTLQTNENREDEKIIDQSQDSKVFSEEIVENHSEVETFKVQAEASVIETADIPVYVESRVTVDEDKICEDSQEKRRASEVKETKSLAITVIPPSLVPSTEPQTDVVKPDEKEIGNEKNEEATKKPLETKSNAGKKTSVPSSSASKATTDGLRVGVKQGTTFKGSTKEVAKVSTSDRSSLSAKTSSDKGRTVGAMKKPVASSTNKPAVSRSVHPNGVTAVGSKPKTSAPKPGATGQSKLVTRETPAHGAVPASPKKLGSKMSPKTRSLPSTRPTRPAPSDLKDTTKKANGIAPGRGPAASKTATHMFPRTKPPSTQPVAGSTPAAKTASASGTSKPNVATSKPPKSIVGSRTAVASKASSTSSTVVSVSASRTTTSRTTTLKTTVVGQTTTSRKVPIVAAASRKPLYPPGPKPTDLTKKRIPAAKDKDSVSARAQGSAKPAVKKAATAGSTTSSVTEVVFKERFEEATSAASDFTEIRDAPGTPSDEVGVVTSNYVSGKEDCLSPTLNVLASPSTPSNGIL